MDMWPSIQLRRFVRLKSGDFISAEDIEPEGEYPVYGGNGIRGFTSVCNTIGPIAVVGRQGAHCGNVQIVEGRAWVSEHALRCFPEKPLNVSFIRFALESLDLGQYSVSAAQPGLSTDNLKPLTIPFPPLSVQERIAAFLNDKTAQIDALIEKKQQLLKRLAEKRQAIITQAVTKGLNPSAPMKDSGIDWLGQIPAHWRVWPIKRVITTATYGVSASLEPSGDVAILRMGNLQDGELDFADLRYLDDIDQQLTVQPRDVVFNRTNSLDLVGKSAIYRGNHKGKLSLASYLVLFRFDDRFDPEYANYAMNADVLLTFARTLALPSIGQANLNPNRYAAISFPVPPVTEQLAIAQNITTKLAGVREIESVVKGSIKQLEEYRSALVTASVTGQIEVPK